MERQWKNRTRDNNRDCDIWFTEHLGKDIAVRIADELVGDKGEAAALRVAERKLQQLIAAGKSLRGIVVTNADR